MFVIYLYFTFIPLNSIILLLNFTSQIGTLLILDINILISYLNSRKNEKKKKTFIELILDYDC